MKCIRLMRFILWYDGTKYPQRFDEQELTYRSCPPGLQDDDVQSRNWTLEWDLYREEGLNIENKRYRVESSVREIDVQGDTLVCVHYHRWGIVIKGGYIYDDDNEDYNKDGFFPRWDCRHRMFECLGQVMDNVREQIRIEKQNLDDTLKKYEKLPFIAR